MGKISKETRLALGGNGKTGKKRGKYEVREKR